MWDTKASGQLIENNVILDYDAFSLSRVLPQQSARVFYRCVHFAMGVKHACLLQAVHKVLEALFIRTASLCSRSQVMTPCQRLIKDCQPLSAYSAQKLSKELQGAIEDCMLVDKIRPCLIELSFKAMRCGKQLVCSHVT